MRQEWETLYQAALAVAKPKKLSEQMEAGWVGAAVLGAGGRIYTGVCIDTDCSLGFCAERAALAAMFTAGEYRAQRICAVAADGRVLSPCGACRELMVQLMPKHYREIEVMLDYERKRIVTLGELTPEWWIQGERGY